MPSIFLKVNDIITMYLYGWYIKPYAYLYFYQHRQRHRSRSTLFSCSACAHSICARIEDCELIMWALDLGNDWSSRCVISCEETILTFSVMYHSNIVFWRVKKPTSTLITWKVSYNFRFLNSILQLSFTSVA